MLNDTDSDKKQTAKLLVRILVTVLLLVWVFGKTDLRQFVLSMKTIRLEFLAAVWFITAVVYWINAAKMRLILKEQDCIVDTGTLFGVSAIVSLYSMILPGPVSSSVKWYLLKKDTGKGSNVLSSMVYNQLSEMVIVTLLGLIAIALANTTGQLQIRIIPIMIAVVIIVMCALLLNTKTGKKINDLCRHILKPLPVAVRKGGEKVLSQLEAFQTIHWQFHFKIILLTLVAALAGGVAVYIYAAKAAGINVPIGVLVWQCVAVYLLGKLPISIANLGIREATLVGTMAIYGVGASAAILMSMILFSTMVLMAVIGAIYQCIWITTPKY